MRRAEPRHVMCTFPSDMEWPTRGEADSFPLTGLPQRPVTWLAINQLDLATETFERSPEPADDDNDDDADTEADDEDGDEDDDEDDADTDEHEHGGEA